MGNLRGRLKRIHEVKKIDPVRENHEQETNTDFINLGWKPCGYKVMEREISLSSPFKNIKNLPQTLPILIPDLNFCGLPEIEDFLFFDLETTGLSGGAGTVAFLAAFGKIQNDKLVITQYLLQDYPGENDFLEKVLERLNSQKSVIVSYNGKCFDSQIIKTRCIMYRIRPPLFHHVDLLHPARRLWKSIIKDCSQASVETKILGLSREGDIPGSLAPEIWFEFLKTGNTDRLIGICDHNLSDISGLSTMLCAVILIASDPFVINKYNYDTERLARSVYAYAYRQMVNGNYEKPLELINKAVKALEADTLWHKKIMRRKIHLEKKINKL